MKTWQEVLDAYTAAADMVRKWEGRDEKTAELWKAKVAELERRWPELAQQWFRDEVWSFVGLELALGRSGRLQFM